MTCDVLVIGGGVSGLAAAYELVQRGHDVRVVERQVNFGGNAVSSRFDSMMAQSPGSGTISRSRTFRRS